MLFLFDLLLTDCYRPLCNQVAYIYKYLCKKIKAMNQFANILICACASVALMAGCRSNNSDDELKHHHHHNHNHEAHAHSHEGHNHDHEEGKAAEASAEEHAGGEIVLAPEMAERFGVTVETVSAAPLASTVRATGTVLDAADGIGVVVAPVAGTVHFSSGILPGANVRAGAVVATVNAQAVAGGDSNAAAKAALDAAKRELDRLEPLHADRLVTDDVYNAARATYESARAAYSSRAAGGRAVAPVGGTLTSLDVAQGQYVEAGAPIASISSARHLVLQVDVPERLRGRLAEVNGVNVRVPGSEQVVALNARRVATAPSVKASMPGYVPVYFEFSNDGTLAPGVAVDAWLTSAGEGTPVISVPRSSVSEQQGGYFVYVRLDEDCYDKLPVRLGASDGMRVVVTEGLHGGETVVTAGVTAVRLAENSGVIPEGHSHNH